MNNTCSQIIREALYSTYQVLLQSNNPSLCISYALTASRIHQRSRMEGYRMLNNGKYGTNNNQMNFALCINYSWGGLHFGLVDSKAYRYHKVSFLSQK